MAASPFASTAAEMAHNEIIIWFTTTSRDLSPQPRPVWFIWYQDHFLIYSRPTTHKVRHVSERPHVALHFNTNRTASRNVVVFKGSARLASEVPSADQIPAYVAKYREGMQALGMSPEEFGRAYSSPILVDIEDVEGMA